ncbi:MAG: SOS response-associated peptidase family protein [Deltaproteobacteria bacterium]
MDSCLKKFEGSGAFCFPGLWDCWIDRDTGKPRYTFTIITTHANSLLRRIHDRMPVMHRRDIGRQWLDQGISSELELLLRTQPVLSDEIKAYEVSTLVNSPENDSPECVRRVSAGKKT